MTTSHVPKAITLRGVVVPMVWDEDGRVRAYGVSAVGEKEYLLGGREKPAVWMGLLRREVEVEGFVTAGPGGRDLLEVTGYRVIIRGDKAEMRPKTGSDGQAR